MKIEFGGYYDNFEIFCSAQRLIHVGRKEEGFELLSRLETHIKRTKETKSVRFLLPNIDFYLRSTTAGLVAFVSNEHDLEPRMMDLIVRQQAAL